MDNAIVDYLSFAVDYIDIINLHNTISQLNVCDMCILDKLQTENIKAILPENITQKIMAQISTYNKDFILNVLFTIKCNNSICSIIFTAKQIAAKYIVL